LAKKAAEQKREKKLQAKARKASQKAAHQEVKVEPKVELRQSLEPEPGWEVNTNRKPRGPKDGKESREPIVVDVKVPVRSHALIIGKQGEGLRKLTEDLDVIITMPKRDSGDDMILIKGLPKDVHMAKRAILELATKGYSSVTQPGWVTKTFQLKNKYQLSLVFGEKGSTLQSISKASGTRVQMPEKKAVDKNDKEKKIAPEQLLLTVTGEERAIETAFSLIQELIDQGYTKTTHPDWVGDEVHVGEQAMGAIIGPRGARIKELSKKFKVKVDVPPRSDPSVKNEILYVKGLPKHVALFKQEIADILASREAPIEQEVPDPAWQEDVQEVAW
jgi:polyribonucleotide nucleotidyltransferase